MTKKIDKILSQVLERVEPPKEDLKFIDEKLEEFLRVIKKNIKSLRLNVEVFVGGSFAKKTVIKKDPYELKGQSFSVSKSPRKLQGIYDVDVFVRFNQKYKKEDISKLTKKIIGKMKQVSVIHGSRDYFRVNVTSNFFIELIPVMKVKNPNEAENITDLSYSHVKYLNKKIKSKKILNEIRIAKAFCYINNCYGAESYIQGFSGYGLELLIYYYGSFLKFIKAIIKIEERKVIDIEKHHKNKRAVLMDLNSSKLQSPIILIDPTYKHRNVLAALSYETFEKFRRECQKFLKNPSMKAFEIKKIDLDKVKKNAMENKCEFILIEVKTHKQEGDVAGSKLLKFYKHLNKAIARFFEIKNKGFNYNKKKSARYFFVIKSKGKILREGPFANDEKNVKKFKKVHKKTFIKSKRIHAWEKVDFNIKEFIEKWKKKNKKQMKEMSIKSLNILK